MKNLVLFTSHLFIVMAIRELPLFTFSPSLKRGPLALQPKDGKEPANKVISERQ